MWKKKRKKKAIQIDKRKKQNKKVFVSWPVHFDFMVLWPELDAGSLRVHSVSSHAEDAPKVTTSTPNGRGIAYSRQMLCSPPSGEKSWDKTVRLNGGSFQKPREFFVMLQIRLCGNLKPVVIFASRSHRFTQDHDRAPLSTPSNLDRSLAYIFFFAFFFLVGRWKTTHFIRMA